MGLLFYIMCLLESYVILHNVVILKPISGKEVLSIIIILVHHCLAYMF